jgi:hypothetical protein
MSTGSRFPAMSAAIVAGMAMLTAAPAAIGCGADARGSRWCASFVGDAAEICLNT